MKNCLFYFQILDSHTAMTYNGYLQVCMYKEQKQESTGFYFQIDHSWAEPEIGPNYGEKK